MIQIYEISVFKENQSLSHCLIIAISKKKIVWIDKDFTKNI